MACYGQFNKPIDTKTMNTELINSITQYVEKHIGEFHANRIAKLQSLNLKELLSRKNPYMFRAKNIITAGEMVESIASATMSSAEESIFGNWMEGVAMFVANEVYGGYKSSAEGIDLEFDKEGVHYFVSVKSGPAWSNSTSMKNRKNNSVQPDGFSIQAEKLFLRCVLKVAAMVMTTKVITIVITKNTAVKSFGL